MHRRQQTNVYNHAELDSGLLRSLRASPTYNSIPVSSLTGVRTRQDLKLSCQQSRALSSSCNCRLSAGRSSASDQESNQIFNKPQQLHLVLRYSVFSNSRSVRQPATPVSGPTGRSVLFFVVFKKESFRKRLAFPAAVSAEGRCCGSSFTVPSVPPLTRRWDTFRLQHQHLTSRLARILNKNKGKTNLQMLYFYPSGEARYVYTNDERTHTHGDGGSRRTDPDPELFPRWCERSEARR